MLVFQNNNINTVKYSELRFIPREVFRRKTQTVTVLDFSQIIGDNDKGLHKVTL